MQLRLVRDYKDPADLGGLSDYLLTNYTLVMELVHSMPRQGVKSMFTFGWWSGYLQGLLFPHAKQLIFYDPQRWQNHIREEFGLEKNPTDWRHIAEGLFPEQRYLFQRVKDHNSADAVMIGVAYLLGAAPSTPIIRRLDHHGRCAPIA